MYLTHSDNIILYIRYHQVNSCVFWPCIDGPTAVGKMIHSLAQENRATVLQDPVQLEPEYLRLTVVHLMWVKNKDKPPIWELSINYTTYLW